MRLPDLEERFLAPPGWAFDSFERKGRKIRYGGVLPANSRPDAIVIYFQGLGEFSEKVFETARWCLSKNIGFYTLDWMGQGKSARYLDNPHKRHASSFDEDVKDAHYFITNHLPKDQKASLVLLAHSMGGNIGLRFIHDYPTIFACAGFSAPMIGILALSFIPSVFIAHISGFFNSMAGTSYVPGGGNWDLVTHTEIHERMLTSDPVRSRIQNQWRLADPELQVGSVTYGWVYEAQDSCRVVQIPDFVKSITIPCLFGLAEEEHLVDNRATRRFIKNLKNAKFLEFPKARHEILLEQDFIRDAFLDDFYNLIKKTIIDP